MHQYHELKKLVVANPCTSHWLKDAISQLESRDPVDALQDVEELLLLMQHRERGTHNQALALLRERGIAA